MVGNVAVATWTNPSSANLDHETVYVASTGDPNTAFGNATDWSGPSASVSLDAYDFTPVIGTGNTYYLYPRAYNGTGAGSNWVGPQTVTV
jgi:hypothetical protein